MNRFRAAVLAAVAGLTVLQPMQASAQVEDLVRGVGTVIAICALTQSCGTGRAQQQRQPTNQAPVARAPRAQPSAAVMADQNALNYFGFPAGSADGLSGGKTRTAISTYQGFMGFPATGSLTEYERSILNTGYQRAMAGAANQYPNLVASEGLRGLLRGFQREAMGMPVDPSAQSNVASASQQAPVQQPAVPAEPALQAGGTTDAAAAPRLPTFATRPVDVSMAQHCSEINILTTANGRPEAADTISDPQFALDEQFCAARGYAISRTQQLSAEIQGVSDAEMQAQCEAMVATMAPQVARLGSDAPADMAISSAAFVSDFNMPMDQLSTTGEVCLGVGYRIDDADLVMASTMILVAADKSAYGEVFGHHLRKGFGAPVDKTASDDWYDFSLAALDDGQAPAFLPTQSAQRSAVIRNALDWTGQVGTATSAAAGVRPAAATN